MMMRCGDVRALTALLFACAAGYGMMAMFVLLDPAGPYDARWVGWLLLGLSACCAVSAAILRGYGAGAEQ